MATAPYTDDPAGVLLLITLGSGLSAYFAVKRFVKRQVDHHMSAARMGIPFSGAKRWKSIEDEVTHYRRRMNVLQIAATVGGLLLGYCWGLILLHFTG
jgi:hypothetical protein